MTKVHQRAIDALMGISDRDVNLPRMLADWEQIHSRFLHSKYFKSQKDILRRIQAKQFKPGSEDGDIINAIKLWKINRQITVPSITISLLNMVAKRIETPEEALADKAVPHLVAQLLLCDGIRLPVASAILKFYRPTAFPIIDDRAHFMLYRERLPTSAGFDVYAPYVKKCLEIHHDWGIPFENVDQVLYQMDKESGRTLREKQA